MSFARLGTTSILTCTQDRHVAVIEFNRPDAMNAISSELLQDLQSALDLAEQDESVRAIVLTGAGVAFCAGYDLREEPELGATSSERLRSTWRVSMGASDRLWRIMRLDKPVIAAVNGWCLGGGFWYALAADVTLASKGAVFGQPEVREIANSSFLFAAIAGWKNAHRYTLTGDHFDAEEAYRIGIVNEVLEHDELMPASLSLANRLAELPPDSVRLNKAVTTLGLEAMGLRAATNVAELLAVIVNASTDAADVAEIRRVRATSGMKASLRVRDGSFWPEPGGPRSGPPGREA